MPGEATEWRHLGGQLEDGHPSARRGSRSPELEDSVAKPAELLVAKLHKVHDRIDTPRGGTTRASTTSIAC